MELSRLVRVRQNFPDRALGDVYSAVRQEMASADWVQAVPAGARIAVGVGSRGIANIDIIAKAAVDHLKEAGAQPFLIPVMGSHGAASAEGQADVLAHYGITEATMGAPVVSRLDVATVGKTAEGIDVVMAKDALEADGCILLGRVKWHTDFEGGLESGIHKMMAIGLGKWAGAKVYHAFAYRLGLEQVIRSVGEVILGTGKMLGGLAILEDAHHHTAEVHALGVDGMVEREEALLARCKSWKANVPGGEIDLLIVDELGKNISGAGMDTKVVNRSVRYGDNQWKGVPRVNRIFVRDISDLSYGNACGMGMADVANKRMVDKVNLDATWVNSLTASNTLPSRIPLHYETDRECIEKIAPTVGKLDLSTVTFAWIRNTQELHELMVSENLLPRVLESSEIEVIGEPEPFPFDSEGNLLPVLEPAAVAH